MMAGDDLPKEPAQTASDQRSSTSSGDSDPRPSFVPLAGQRTLPPPQPPGEAVDPVVLERQRTAASIYEETVGGGGGCGTAGDEAGGTPTKRRPSVSTFSRPGSRLPPEQWPEFGGGKGVSPRPLPSPTQGRSVLALLMERQTEYPPLMPDQGLYVVDFTGPGDPMHGQNWPLRKKLVTAAVLGYCTFVCSWGSSVFAPAAAALSTHFSVSVEVSLLSMSLYVLGFAFGPLVCPFPPPPAPGRC